MELRHLRYFVAVAHRQHFTQAAEELFIAQPALSQQIQALEHELGVVLFERTSRQVRLTSAGAALLVYAERILAEVAHARDEMQAFAGLKRGRVALGVLQSLGAYRLPDLLARFHEHFAGIEMVLREDVTENLLEQVKAGELDVALTHTIGDIFPLRIAETQLLTRALIQEDILLVAHPQHPLAHRVLVTPEELRDEAFILFKPGSGLRQAVMYLGQVGNFTPRILFESGDNGTIRGLTAEGLGLSVLPRSVIDAPGKAIATLQLTPPLPARTIVAVWHRRIAHSHAASAFLDFLQEDFHLSTNEH